MIDQFRKLDLIRPVLWENVDKWLYCFNKEKKILFAKRLLSHTISRIFIAQKKQGRGVSKVLFRIPPPLFPPPHVTSLESTPASQFRGKEPFALLHSPPPDQTVGVTRGGGYVLQSGGLGLTGRWRQEMCLPFFSFPSSAQYKTRNATALPRKKNRGKTFSLFR